MSWGNPGNSKATGARKIRGNVMSLAETIERDCREFLPAFLKQERRSAKVIALHVGSTPRSVENWRDGLNMPQVRHFFALALQIPELKALALRWLEADNGNGEDPSRLANEIAQFLASRTK